MYQVAPDGLQALATAPFRGGVDNQRVLLASRTHEDSA